MRHAAVTMLLVLAAAGCATEAPAPSYRQQVVQHRVERDMAMRSEESVLTDAARSRFGGLRYFEVDSTYRFAVELERAPAPDTVLMAGSAGLVVPQVVVGRVTLPFEAGAERLTVYHSLEAADRRLWIPFTDATNGAETYGAGRYLDVRRTGERGAVVVDFNYAYNPTCAYNPDYNCPLPPPQNRLPLAVSAGEKRVLGP